MKVSADSPTMILADTNLIIPLLIETLCIACESNISAYDARFIALARSFRLKLVTEDTRLRKACPADTLSLDQAIATFP